MIENDWKVTKLSDLVGDAIGGLWGSPSDSAKPDEADVLVVRGADFRNWATRRALDATPRRISARSLESRRLLPGDLVLEVSGGSPAQPVGRTLVIDELATTQSARPLICSNFCRKLRLKAGVNPYFVKRQLEWLYHSGHTDQFQTSTTNIRNLQVEDFLNGTSIALPDEKTQARLTQDLDQLDGKRSSSSNHVAAARRAIERSRQSVLAAACSGRLTADWRARNSQEDSVADALGASKVWSRKRQQAVREFSSNGLPPIPDSWVWVPLAAVSESILGKMLDKEKNKGELQRYLRNINVRWRNFDLSDIQELRFESGEAERYSLQPGDVLVCEGGEPGRAAVWRQEESNMRFQKAIHRVRCEQQLHPDWLVNVLQSHSFSGLLSNYFTGTGIAHLTGVSLARVPVPLPPIREQLELVRLTEAAWSIADEVMARLASAERNLDRSSQAILAKAFRGGLLATSLNRPRLIRSRNSD